MGGMGKSMAATPMRRLAAYLVLGVVLVLCFALGQDTSAADRGAVRDSGVVIPQEEMDAAPLQATLGPSSTPEPTDTPTVTPTDTLQPTPTDTPSPTPTDTLTPTPTDTPMPTPTNTPPPTNTPSPTSSPTPTNTLTPTNSPTLTLVPTVTYTPSLTPECPATVGDRVWLDTNGNGIWEEGEAGVGGVTVRLYDKAGNYLGSKITAVNGYYYFDGLHPGEYYIEFVLPDGYTFVPPNQGDDYIVDSDADPVTGLTVVFRLRPCDHHTFWDAGLWLYPQLEGYKFWDENDNGDWDWEEPKVGGVSIIVRDQAGEIVLETTTVDAPGTPEHGTWSATLEGDPGIYTIEEVVPEGWRQTAPVPNVYRIQTYGDGSYVLLTARPEGVEGLSFGNFKYSACYECPEWVLIQSDRNNKNVDIWRMRYDGTRAERLTHDLAQDIEPIWDYTGTQIAFASVRDDDWEIYRMDANGDGETNVTKWPLADDGISPSQDLAPHWNCSEIVFQTDRHGDWEIYRTDPSGINQVRLTYHPANDLAPHWSPYSDWIAFESDRDGNWEIYLMDPNGNNVERLTYNEADDRNVTWSTDQKWIFFESDRADGNLDIYKMDLETRETFRLTDDPSHDTDPDAMPYCEWVFFESNRDKNPDVWRMRYDGTQEMNVVLGDTGRDYWADHLDHEPGPWVHLFLPLVFQ